MRVQPTSFQQKSIECSDTLSDLVPLVKEVLTDHNSLVIVCGSISTGGKSVEENLSNFDKTIQSISDCGFQIFDQMPWEKKIGYFHEEFYETHQRSEYYWDILLVFYQPIFSSGKIKKAFFLPNWQSSTGATWEHEQCKKYGIEIVYIPENWTQTFDTKLYPELFS